MQAEAEGYYSCDRREVKAGARYRYRLNRDRFLPDPASRFQPEGVHGPSQVVDPGDFEWSDEGWKGIRLEEVILYELHVGTFTPEGTFAALEEKLPVLEDLGVTAVELMPIAEFPGGRNWGYDGVDLFAPSRAYGTPNDLRRLVNRAHRLGIAVFLDVVYNHLGPEGAYLSAFSPHYFTDRHRSPWGDGVNLDGEKRGPVRDFFIENALHWVHEYHIDGLRLDATHAMADESSPHFLAELAAKVRASLPSGRSVLIVAEDDRNEARLVRPVASGGDGLDAVWSDDFHHQTRVLLAGDNRGYYQDFRPAVGDLVEIIEKGWLYAGRYSAYRERPWGTDPRGIPPQRFVHCIQNHDQVGNRAFGERLNHQADPAAYRAASALLLCSPSTPLLFMGQEWGASTPFLYFTDHPEELGRRVTEGRRREFRRFQAFQDPENFNRIPDPQLLETFLKSKLLWPERGEETHRGLLALYRALIRVRRTEPALHRRTARFDAGEVGGGVIALRRDAPGAPSLLALVLLKGGGRVTLGSAPITRPPARAGWEVLFTTEGPLFAPGSTPPSIDLGAMTIDFPSPAAVILRSLAPKTS
jgi:maltooligosyltrehalose trehalohydrolase